jgi:small subunit ribosomal protein S1
MSSEHIDNDSLKIGDSGETPEREVTFADLLEKSGYLPAKLKPGQKVSAKVISISDDLVYIDLPGKSEGVIDLNEFIDENKILHLREGDEIEAFFMTVKDGIRRLTTLINGYTPFQLNSIRDAYDAGLPVDGLVKREIKGGFEVLVGGVRCFCPFSQIDLKGVREGSIFIGQTLPFMVLEYKDNGRNIIFSRRVLLEQEKQARIERLQDTLTEGMEVTTVVSSIQNFGAFVDLGGIDGLIPFSEISWNKINHPGDVLSPTQNITAKIISIEWDNNRVTLSLKAMQPDPWALAVEKYPPGSRINGTIVRLAPFGAFVNLEPGIDGLIHISNLGTGRRINHPKEVVTAGQLVEIYVLAVDQANRKISLSMQPKAKPKKIVLPEVGKLLEGIVEKVMPFGIFLKMNNGLTGLIPNSEMRTSEGTDYRRMFPAGTEMQAVVIEVDKLNNKVRLSYKAALEKEAQAEYNEYIDSIKQSHKSASNLGSLGEILKAKMEEKKLSG